MVPRVVLKARDPTSPSPIDEIALWIEANLGGTRITNVRNGGGGSGWASTHVLDLSDGRKLFAKIARGRGASMFRGELEGLNAMRATETIGVPRALHADDLYGEARGGSWILMEHVEFARGRGGGGEDMAALGRQLALMHAADVPPRPRQADADGNDDGNADANNADASKPFGFHVDNTIGATPQQNGWMSDWVSFFRERRLWRQLEMANDTNLLRMGERALDRMDSFFPDAVARPAPSVLHGDLWSGNHAWGTIGGRDGTGGPVLFDPATYYGHSEAEFGMSWCASFDDYFWGAYHEIMPKEAESYAERRQLYMLYHYLNHLNLFGGGYYYQCEGILKRLG